MKEAGELPRTPPMPMTLPEAKLLPQTCETGTGANAVMARRSVRPKEVVGTLRVCQDEIRWRVPVTQAGFCFLHNNVAMPLMHQGLPKLGRAYQYLDDANQLHKRIYGRPSGVALYNMACCLSMG